ncbi:MAG: hypothetical protein HPY54_14085 [Chthonomonadetes bacterium]|nr:hypothetical protein [Chthonomonadetes bacterium]
MRAILYLNLRLLINGIRRTFTNPLRATAAALVILWFGFTFLGNLMSSAGTHHTPMPPELITRNRDYLIAFLTVMHLMVLWPALSPTVGFRSVQMFTQADVNFLFPSPLRRSLVFFFLLFSRGTVNSLFLLLILLILVISMGRDLLAGLFIGEIPTHLGFVWVYPVMYLLTFFTLLGVGIWVALKEELREGFARRVRWAFWGALLALAGRLGWHGYQAQTRRDDPLGAVVQHLLNDPVVAIPLLPMRALAESAMVFTGGWTPAVTAGFVFWAGALAGIVYLLLQHQHLFYDLAAGIASHSATYALRWQDPGRASYESAVAAAAKQPQKVARWRVFTEWKPQGAWALVWCHSLLMARLSAGWQYLLMLMVPIVSMIVIVFVRGDMSSDMRRFLVLSMMYSFAFFATMSAQSWLVGVLRRAEMNRSLPFPARVVVLTEIAPPTLFLYACLALAWVAMVWFAPEHLLTLVWHTLIVMSLVPVLLTVMLILFLLFPDQSDYTQRVLLGFFMLPVILLAIAPAVLVGVAGALLDLPLWITTMLVVGANAGMLWLCLYLANYQYTRFNPAE